MYAVPVSPTSTERHDSKPLDGLVRIIGKDKTFLEMPPLDVTNCATYQQDLVHLAPQALFESLTQASPDAQDNLELGHEFQEMMWKHHQDRFRRVGRKDPHAPAFDFDSDSDDEVKPEPTRKPRKLSKLNKVVPKEAVLPTGPRYEYRGETGMTVRRFSVWHFWQPIDYVLNSHESQDYFSFAHHS